MDVQLNFSNKFFMAQRASYHFYLKNSFLNNLKKWVSQCVYVCVCVCVCVLNVMYITQWFPSSAGTPEPPIQPIQWMGCPLLTHSHPCSNAVNAFFINVEKLKKQKTFSNKYLMNVICDNISLDELIKINHLKRNTFTYGFIY